MHPALRSRIRGYGYEVYVNSDMPDTSTKPRRLIRFIAQEVTKIWELIVRYLTSINRQFQSYCEKLLKKGWKKRKTISSPQRARWTDSIAGDLTQRGWIEIHNWAHVLGARNIAKPLEQQVADRMIERRRDYSLLVNSGQRVGRVNGLAVLGANSGLSDFSGIMLPVEALVTPSQGGGGKIHATGGLSDLAKESVTNVSAVIKK